MWWIKICKYSTASLVFVIKDDKKTVGHLCRARREKKALPPRGHKLDSSPPFSKAGVAAGDDFTMYNYGIHLDRLTNKTLPQL